LDDQDDVSTLSGKQNWNKFKSANENLILERKNFWGKEEGILRSRKQGYAVVLTYILSAAKVRAQLIP
jgi:hypothetical protein